MIIIIMASAGGVEAEWAGPVVPLRVPPHVQLAAVAHVSYAGLRLADPPGLTHLAVPCHPLLHPQVPCPGIPPP